jgi:hypothetical protein
MSEQTPSGDPLAPPADATAQEQPVSADQVQVTPVQAEPVQAAAVQPEPATAEPAPQESGPKQWFPNTALGWASTVLTLAFLLIRFFALPALKLALPNLLLWAITGTLFAAFAVLGWLALRRGGEKSLGAKIMLWLAAILGFWFWFLLIVEGLSTK